MGSPCNSLYNSVQLPAVYYKQQWEYTLAGERLGSHWLWSHGAMESALAGLLCAPCPSGQQLTLRSLTVFCQLFTRRWSIFLGQLKISFWTHTDLPYVAYSGLTHSMLLSLFLTAQAELIMFHCPFNCSGPLGFGLGWNGCSWWWTLTSAEFCWVLPPHYFLLFLLNILWAQRTSLSLCWLTWSQFFPHELWQTAWFPKFIFV